MLKGLLWQVRIAVRMCAALSVVGFGNSGCSDDNGSSTPSAVLPDAAQTTATNSPPAAIIGVDSAVGSSQPASAGSTGIGNSSGNFGITDSGDGNLGGSSGNTDGNSGDIGGSGGNLSDSGGNEDDVSTATSPQADAGITDATVQGGEDANTPTEETPWEWPTGKPEDYGLDTAVLEDAANSIQARCNNRYGIVVIRKGVLIYEKYWDGGPDDQHIIYSCTKSWGSTLIGIAATQGLLSVTDEVTKWVPQPVTGIAQGATVEHLLTQSAQSIPPGTAFQYDMGTLINTLPEILEAASGMKNHDFYEQYLAKPLGLSMIWPECPDGGCQGTRYHEGFIQFGNNPASGAPLPESPQSTIRDQAKLGWLWANNGVWNGEVLIDPEFIAAGSKPGEGFRATYGYLWWIQNDEQYAAMGGMANCFVNLMPSRELVIAVMGENWVFSDVGTWGAFQSVVDAIKD